MPTVSVVIPLYNKEAYIKRALDSVLNQTFNDFEIIVVDDGSKDGGADVVRNILDPRIRLIQQANSGVSSARNSGIFEAQASIISFLDADDEYKPEFLATILRLREKYPEAGILATAYVSVEGDGKIVSPSYKTIPPPPWEGVLLNYFKSAVWCVPVCASAVAIPRYVLDVVGMFPVGERFGEDLDLWMRIALKYPVAFSHVVGGVYHENALNRVMYSGVIEPERRLKKTILEAISTGGVSCENKGFLHEYLNKKDLELVTQFIWAGRKKDAWCTLVNCSTKVFWFWKLCLCFLSIFPTSAVLFFYKLKNKCFYG